MNDHQGTVFGNEKETATVEDLTGCLRATVDVFFDALVKVDVKSTLQVINYMAEKTSRLIIQQLTSSSSTLEESRDPPPSTSCAVHWISILQGFTSSIQPANLSTRTLHLLTIVDILENIRLCKKGLHDTKTFYDLYQLLSCVSWFSELKGDTYHQKTIHELQEETRNQELICHYVISKSTKRPEVKTFCDNHPLSEFCKKTIDFVRSVIEDKFNKKKVKGHTQTLSHDLSYDQSEHSTCVNTVINPDEEHPYDISLSSSAPQQSSDDSESVRDDDSEEDTVSGDENIPSVGNSSNASRGQICSSSDSGITVTCKAKKKRIYWSPEEVIYLKKGVKKYGVGNWEKLLKTYPFHEERSLRSLSDKWYALHGGYKSNTKRQQVAKSPKHKRATECKSSGKRKPVVWSKEELQWLKEGVKKLGPERGMWKEMLKRYPFHSNRTDKSLRDKWRYVMTH